MASCSKNKLVNLTIITALCVINKKGIYAQTPFIINNKGMSAKMLFKIYDGHLSVIVEERNLMKHVFNLIQCYFH